MQDLAQFLQSNTWIVTLLTGGAVGALLTHWFSRKRQHTDITLKLFEQFLGKYPEMAEVKRLLRDDPDLADDKALYRVIALGDWYEMLALYWHEGLTDAPVLRRSGVVGEMRKFREAALKSTNPQVMQAIGTWTKMQWATTKER